MITNIDYVNNTVTVYEGNIGGKVKLSDYTYSAFLLNYDRDKNGNKNQDIKIYTCVNKYQRLDNNGEIVVNDFPNLYYWR